MINKTKLNIIRVKLVLENYITQLILTCFNYNYKFLLKKKNCNIYYLLKVILM